MKSAFGEHATRHLNVSWLKLMLSRLPAKVCCGIFYLIRAAHTHCTFNGNADSAFFAYLKTHEACSRARPLCGFPQRTLPLRTPYYMHPDTKNAHPIMQQRQMHSEKFFAFCVERNFYMNGAKIACFWHQGYWPTATELFQGSRNQKIKTK